jgi:hypothetical protein
MTVSYRFCSCTLASTFFCFVLFISQLVPTRGYSQTAIFPAGKIQGNTLLLGPVAGQVVGNYAYVVSASSNSLEIIDVTNRSAPAHVGNIVNGQGGALLDAPTSVYVLGDLAYITSHSNALEIVDVSDPSAPVHKGVLVDGAGGALIKKPSSVFVQGNYAYVTSSESNALEIIDVTNPATPTHKGSLQDGVAVARLTSPVSIVG